MGFHRTILSQFFVVVLFVVNWGLTLVVLFITIAATDGQKVDVSILILPVTVILTIPALRALWVGAPAFGLLLDSVGLFVQMVVVAVCSMFLVIGVGLSSKAVQRANEPQEEIIEPRELSYTDELRSPEVIPLKRRD